MKAKVTNREFENNNGVTITMNMYDAIMIRYYLKNLKDTNEALTEILEARAPGEKLTLNFVLDHEREVGERFVEMLRDADALEALGEETAEF